MTEFKEAIPAGGGKITYHFDANKGNIALSKCPVSCGRCILSPSVWMVGRYSAPCQQEESDTLPFNLSLRFRPVSNRTSRACGDVIALVAKSTSARTMSCRR